MSERVRLSTLSIDSNINAVLLPQPPSTEALVDATKRLGKGMRVARLQDRQPRSCNLIPGQDF